MIGYEVRFDPFLATNELQDIVQYILHGMKE